MQTETTNETSILERERRKRIKRREYVLEFSTNLNRAVKKLDKNIDRAIESIRKDKKELFPEPYRDWRTNEIIE